MKGTIEQLYQEMADLTYSKCKETCKIKLGWCCSGEYCDMAKEIMEKAGVPIPEMPFVKDGKCVVPPHFRPLCTLHQCKISNLGTDWDDPEWSKKYYKLRDKIDALHFIEKQYKENKV